MNFFNPNPYQQMYGQPLPDQLAQFRQPYQQQPYQNQQFQQPPQQGQYQQSNLIWVKDEMDARNYPVGPNCSVTMRNETVSEIYIKKADATGRPEFETYSLIKKQDAPKQPENPDDRYVTFRELRELLSASHTSQEVHVNE